jgi:hypothetical protein
MLPFLHPNSRGPIAKHLPTALSVVKYEEPSKEISMTEPIPDNTSLFGLLVLSLGNAALVGIGLLPEPSTQQTSVNLELARHNIELLAMLQEKTKGNLTADEHRMLEDLLYNLRLQFVEARRGVC